MDEQITRDRFGLLIDEDISRVDQALTELMKKNGLAENQISAVLRTGGSSAIPAFIDLLVSRFGQERIKEMNLFTTIVRGLAIKAHELELASV